MALQKSPTEITQRILLSEKDLSWCVKCNRRLFPSQAHIPLGEFTIEDIDGMECPRCHMLYLRGSNILAQKLANNFYINVNKLHGETEWKFSRKELEAEADRRGADLLQLKETLQYIKEGKELLEAKARTKQRCETFLRSIKTSQFCLVLTAEKGWRADIVIVFSKSFANWEKHILYCQSPEAKDLMTRAFHSKTPDQFFDYRGRSVTIEDIVFHPDIRQRNVLFPRKIILRKGGGYYDPKNPNAILATAMVYSPFSKSYEPLIVSYDEIEKIYYVDAEKFRTFLHEHGNPELPIAVYQKGKSDSFWGFGDLNEQSFLTGFGYTVNATDNLSRKARQEMLTELVDLGIAKPYEIVNHLHWCVRTFAADKYRFAREKWEEDAAYISFYKANPERFLVAQGVER